MLYDLIFLVVKGMTALALPAGCIWSLNTLFGSHIPLTFQTWFAGLLLLFTLRFYVNKKSPFLWHDHPWYDRERTEAEEEDADDDDEPPPFPRKRPAKKRLRRVK